MKKVFKRLRCKLFKKHHIKCVRKVDKGITLVCEDCGRIFYEQYE